MELLNNRKIILFGASTAGQIALETLHKKGIKVDCFVDNDKQKWGKSFCGKRVYSPEYLLKESPESFLIIISSSFTDEIAAQLIDSGYTANVNFFGAMGYGWNQSPILAKLNQNNIVLNLSDIRAVKLLTRRRLSNASNKLIEYWNKTVKEFLPDIVIDVGTNYGEAIFSANYLDGTQIFGIEANPRLIPFIEESRSQHINKHQIKILNAIASFKAEENVTFYIDKDYSGESSQVKMSDNREYESICVQSIVIDDLFRNVDLRNKKILFKIDVEGFEYDVIRGMKTIINQATAVKGYIEIDNKYLKKSQTDINEYINFLDSTFDIFSIEEGTHQKITKGFLLTALESDESIHLDIVVENH